MDAAERFLADLDALPIEVVQFVATLYLVLPRPAVAVWVSPDVHQEITAIFNKHLESHGRYGIRGDLAVLRYLIKNFGEAFKGLMFGETAVEVCWQWRRRAELLSF